MRTKEVADRVGVNTQTLRYYERRGLLPEPPRSPGGYREYPGSVVQVLHFVKRAQRLGFSLDEVEELLDLAQGGPDSCDTARTLAAVHVQDLDSRIAELQRMREALTELIRTCDSPHEGRRCPLLEAIQSSDEHAVSLDRELS